LDNSNKHACEREKQKQTKRSHGRAAPAHTTFCCSRTFSREVGGEPCLPFKLSVPLVKGAASSDDTFPDEAPNVVDLHIAGQGQQTFRAV
jgi:hypothetical protein